MRADDLRVERAAVAATELSLARCAELYVAVPVVDHGADLLAYQADPFRVARIQVKGATGGLKVFLQYSTSPIIMSYVLDPLGTADVVLLTGDQGWNLPAENIAQGGIASGYDPEEGPDYRVPGRTPAAVLDARHVRSHTRAVVELFDLTAIPGPARL